MPLSGQDWPYLSGGFAMSLFETDKEWVLKATNGWTCAALPLMGSQVGLSQNQYGQ